MSACLFSQLPHYDGYVDVLGGFLQGGSLPVASMHTQFLDVTMHLSAVRDGSTEEGPAVSVQSLVEVSSPSPHHRQQRIEERVLSPPDRIDDVHRQSVPENGVDVFSGVALGRRR